MTTRKLDEGRSQRTGRQEWQNEKEEWGEPLDGECGEGRAGTPGGVGTAEGDVLTQDRLLDRVKETERTDQRQTGRQRARELSLEARVEGGAMSTHPGTRDLAWGLGGRQAGRARAHIPEHRLARRASEAVGEGG